MEWLPIESAPKDGTRILIWGTIESSPMARKHIGCEDMYLAYFAGDCWPAEWLDGYVIEPTHWMPLPHRPKPRRTSAMDKTTAQATIARVRARYSDDAEVSAVCNLASDYVRTWAEPRLLADLIRSQRQQEQFRIAERYGWRGGRAHEPFIPDDERAAFKAETARLIAEAGDKRVTV